jgi:hypothetical protein
MDDRDCCDRSDEDLARRARRGLGSIGGSAASPSSARRGASNPSLWFAWAGSTLQQY